MAREVRNYAVTIPAGTAIAAPLATDLPMPARIARSVRVRIPPGPSGQVGWALASSGVAILPWGPGQWIVGDNEVIEWPLDGQLDSGAWQLIGYNLGVYAHTLYVTFQLDPPGGPGSLGSLAPPLVIGA